MIIALNGDSEGTIRTDYSPCWFAMQFLSPHTLLLHPVTLCHRKIEQDTQSTLAKQWGALVPPVSPILSVCL